jgi:hypothetical protein
MASLANERPRRERKLRLYELSFSTVKGFGIFTQPVKPTVTAADAALFMVSAALAALFAG